MPSELFYFWQTEAVIWPKRQFCSGPELVQPQVQPVETRVVDRVDPLGAIVHHTHKITIQQGFEMLRHRRSADRQALGQIIDGFGRSPQLFQQMAAVWISNRCKGICRVHEQKLRYGFAFIKLNCVF